MFKLSPGNVLLKPSHRRQLMNGLKRALRLNQRLGDLMISISMRRTGRLVEMKADVSNRRGVVGFRARSMIGGTPPANWPHVDRPPA